ncbi:hypothetical protein MYX82_03955 [Acidobacteria bacterium AH-259-D05]|nr:hypothetical protein [Acidobacteria bacterium AH-259-D05]
MKPRRKFLPLTFFVLFSYLAPTWHPHTHFAYSPVAPLASAAPSMEMSLVPTQERSGDIRLAMKHIATPANTSFTTPVYLAAPSAIKLASLTFEVAYPKNAFSFAKVEKGFLLQSGRFTVEARSSPPSSEGELETVQIEISSQDETPEKSPLPNGLLVYMVFEVPEKGEQESITLQNQIVSAHTIEGQLLSKDLYVAENQTVTILGPGMILFACLFYMH